MAYKIVDCYGPVPSETEKKPLKIVCLGVAGAAAKLDFTIKLDNNIHYGLYWGQGSRRKN